MPAFDSKILFILLNRVGLEGLKLSLFLTTSEMSLGENKFMNFKELCWR
jgi:hypothetical protein